MNESAPLPQRPSESSRLETDDDGAHDGDRRTGSYEDVLAFRATKTDAS
jgi:hypothetical protein